MLSNHASRSSVEANHQRRPLYLIGHSLRLPYRSTCQWGSPNPKSARAPRGVIPREAVVAKVSGTASQGLPIEMLQAIQALIASRVSACRDGLQRRPVHALSGNRLAGRHAGFDPLIGRMPVRYWLSLCGCVGRDADSRWMSSSVTPAAMTKCLAFNPLSLWHVTPKATSKTVVLSRSGIHTNDRPRPVI